MSEMEIALAKAQELYEHCKANEIAVLVLVTDEKEVNVRCSGSHKVLSTAIVNGMEQSEELLDIFTDAYF